AAGRGRRSTSLRSPHRSARSRRRKGSRSPLSSAGRAAVSSPSSTVWLLNAGRITTVSNSATGRGGLLELSLRAQPGRPPFHGDIAESVVYGSPVVAGDEHRWRRRIGQGGRPGHRGTRTAASRCRQRRDVFDEGDVGVLVCCRDRGWLAVQPREPYSSVGLQ